MIKTVSLIGLGAVGATVAQDLQTVLGNNLFCIMDKKRKDYYTDKGISINGEKQNFNLVTPEQAVPSDLVIIATKNLQLTDALSQIKNAVGPETMILSLLNGIHSESEIEETYGKEKTLYGFIIDLNSINIKGDIQCAKRGRIVFGEKDNSLSDRIKSIQQLFETANVNYKIPENIQLEMWKKFLINVMFNSLGSICRSTYGGFNSSSLQSAAKKIGKEVVAVANAEGIPLTEKLIDDDIALTVSYGPYGKCSMLQDAEAGRKTENSWFCGTIVKLGAKHNIETPYCQFLWELIDGMEYAKELCQNQN